MWYGSPWFYGDEHEPPIMNSTLQLEGTSKPVSGRESLLASEKVRVMATVDIVIPCYNYAKYLRDCVHSVLSQSGVTVRVLVIDDASPDNTLEVGQELAASDNRVEFRRHAANKGHIATYNEGLIDWSTSEYCVLISADDMLAPGSLSRAVRIMDADRNIGMVYGRTVHFREKAELSKISVSKFSFTRFSGAEWLEGRCRAGHNVITSPEVVVRGSVQRAVGGYRPELPHAGDLEMWLRIAAVSDIAYVKRTPQAFYRLHPASMTKDRNSFVDINQRKAAFDAFLQYHQHIAGVDRLHDLACRALARDALWQACRSYDRNQVEEARAEQLVEFAMTTYPRATSLPEYGALLRRRRLGPTICNRTQVFAAPALIRRVGRILKKQHWERQGI
jgi:glycosyltransferase involved in cell wall biosynthesis